MTPKTRILLGVTGGIAAYKSPDLVRRLDRTRRRCASGDDGRGAEVRIAHDLPGGLRPAHAQRFVGQAAEAAMGHIELARWAQIVLIAPASADFIARLAARPRR